MSKNDSPREAGGIDVVRKPKLREWLIQARVSRNEDSEGSAEGRSKVSPATPSEGVPIVEAGQQKQGQRIICIGDEAVEGRLHWFVGSTEKLRYTTALTLPLKLSLARWGSQ